MVTIFEVFVPTKNKRHILLLRLRLFPRPFELWIPADVGLATLILEVDLRLIERGAKQVVASKVHAGSRRRADAKPVQSQRFAAGCTDPRRANVRT